MIVPFDIYYDDTDHLDKVYHRGQAKIWDGIELLNHLFEKYPNSEINLNESQATALRNILAIILWGEYVAWNVSSEMSSCFEDFGAKMAAVSQAHDEARHFYVIRNYLQKRLDYRPRAIFKPALKVLEEVSRTKNLSKKLLGLQLMVEPVAITIFRFIKQSDVDPLLTDLLPYFEKDEARHISLGVKYLPKLIKKMSLLQKAFFVWWQIRLILHEIRGLECIKKDLETLGINPKDVFEFAENKQIRCLRELSSEIGVGDAIWRPVIKIITFNKNLRFYPHKEHRFVRRAINCFFDAI
tara:strand:- start:1230 stop:2120 length:891 start_codon:yes stop_codon:yes gene_type:complete